MIKKQNSKTPQNKQKNYISIQLPVKILIITSQKVEKLTGFCLLTVTAAIDLKDEVFSVWLHTCTCILVHVHDYLHKLNYLKHIETNIHFIYTYLFFPACRAITWSDNILSISYKREKNIIVTFILFAGK